MTAASPFVHPPSLLVLLSLSPYILYKLVSLSSLPSALPKGAKSAPPFDIVRRGRRRRIRQQNCFALRRANNFQARLRFPRFNQVTILNFLFYQYFNFWRMSWLYSLFLLSSPFFHPFFFPLSLACRRSVPPPPLSQPGHQALQYARKAAFAFGERGGRERGLLQGKGGRRRERNTEGWRAGNLSLFSLRLPRPSTKEKGCRGN